MLKKLTLSIAALTTCVILLQAWLPLESTSDAPPSGVVEAEESDWPEFVLPLLKANAVHELAGAAAAPFRDALNQADERVVRDDFTEYVFHNRVVGNADGPCTFRMIVDESRECPTIVRSDLQCPEW